MPASLTSPADIINDALTRIGYKMPVGSLFDGSEAARVALRVYAQTRDEMLSDGNWEFAERNIQGVLLKSAPPAGYFPPNLWSPAFPAIGWIYSYAFPDDALKVRCIKQPPLFVLDFDPQPHPYSIDNDNGYTPPRRVVLTNVANAVIVYTGQVTDPTSWDVSFSEALAAALGRRLAPVLVGLNNAKLAAADEQAETATAENTQE